MNEMRYEKTNFSYDLWIENSSGVTVRYIPQKEFIKFLQTCINDKEIAKELNFKKDDIDNERKTNFSYHFSIPEREVNKVYIHCSASDNPDHDDVGVIRRWHVDDNGWNDVGYHYFIKKDGTVQKGRDLEKIPAAQKGHNTGSIAICLHGLKEDKFTTEQFDSLKQLCKEIRNNYRMVQEKEITFHGHCEVSNKSCPVFDYKDVLNLDENGIMY